MSKRANAFQRLSTDRAAGHIPPSPNRKYEGGSEFAYDSAMVRLSSFILPVPQLFKPTEYLKGVQFNGHESSYYGFEYKIFRYVAKYVDETIKPWLAENEITKFRIYHLNEQVNVGFDEEPNMKDMIWYKRTQMFIGAGIIFKNPDHRILFKLTF